MDRAARDLGHLSHPTAPNKPGSNILGLITLLVLALALGSLFSFGSYKPEQDRNAQQAAVNAQHHPEGVSLDESAVDQGMRTQPDQPGRALFTGGDKKTVYEFVPAGVRVGSFDDFTGLDDASKAKLAGRTLYYVSYQVTYVNGDPVTSYTPPRGQTASQDVRIIQMSGFKNKANKSGCENPMFNGTFGKGSTLPACVVVSLPKDAQPTALTAADPLSKKPSTLTWPVAVTPR